MFHITGDTHGKVLERLKKINLRPGDCVIVLGDVGLNFYLNKTDANNKRKVNDFLIGHDCWLYCVRGNHEERPQTLGINWFSDSQVRGRVYIQTDYPRIRYFMDGETYMIQGHKTLVIGGAYSVDKFYRLANFKQADGWCGWFKDEQLTEAEMQKISRNVQGQSYDLVLTHTCPVDWEPRDLFLSQIDQSTVDKTMECWLEELKEAFNWKVWLFGHYHSDRMVRPGVEMYYNDSETLSDIFARWDKYRETGELDWWLIKDPMFYAK